MELPIYEFKTKNDVSRIIDSIMFYDKHRYMSLLHLSEDTIPNTIHLRHTLFYDADLSKIKGIYYSIPGEKPLYLLDIPDDILDIYGLVNTGKKTKVSRQTLQRDRINSYPLGYTAFFSLLNDSSLSIRLGFNGESITKEPSVAGKFSWIDHSFDSTLLKNSPEYVDRDYGLDYLYSDKYKCSNIRVNKMGDTVFSTLNMAFFEDYDRDSVFYLPKYEFDDSFEGNFMKRLCDSLCRNDVFCQLWAYPINTSPDSLRILISYDSFLDKEKERVTGVIFNYRRDVPIVLKDFNPMLSRAFGIRNSGRTAVVVFLADWCPFWLDTNGYVGDVRKLPDNNLGVWLYFNGRRLSKRLSKPFEWLME